MYYKTICNIIGRLSCSQIYLNYCFEPYSLDNKLFVAFWPGLWSFLSCTLEGGFNNREHVLLEIFNSHEIRSGLSITRSVGCPRARRKRMTVSPRFLLRFQPYLRGSRLREDRCTDPTHSDARQHPVPTSSFLSHLPPLIVQTVALRKLQGIHGPRQRQTVGPVLFPKFEHPMPCLTGGFA